MNELIKFMYLGVKYILVVFMVPLLCIAALWMVIKGEKNDKSMSEVFSNFRRWVTDTSSLDPYLK